MSRFLIWKRPFEYPDSNVCYGSKAGLPVISEKGVFVAVPDMYQNQLGHRVNVVGLDRVELQSAVQVINLFSSPLPPI